MIQEVCFMCLVKITLKSSLQYLNHLPVHENCYINAMEFLNNENDSYWNRMKNETPN